MNLCKKGKAKIYLLRTLYVLLSSKFANEIKDFRGHAELLT
jgi:hypothetical protein